MASARTRLPDESNEEYYRHIEAHPARRPDGTLYEGTRPLRRNPRSCNNPTCLCIQRCGGFRNCAGCMNPSRKRRCDHNTCPVVRRVAKGVKRPPPPSEAPPALFDACLASIVPKAIEHAKEAWLQRAEKRIKGEDSQKQERLREELGATVASHLAEVEKQLSSALASAEAQIDDALDAARDRTLENLETEEACIVCFGPLDPSATACSTPKCAARTCLECLRRCLDTRGAHSLRVGPCAVKCPACKDGEINVPTLSPSDADGAVALGPVPPTPVPVHGLLPGPEDDDPNEVVWVASYSPPQSPSHN